MITEQLKQISGLSDYELNIIIRTASKRYKSYTIAKRKGKARRAIDHPSPEVKFLQSWISENIFEKLPVHDAVKSYRKGLSVQHNALAHTQQNYLLKLDFTDFFGCITAQDIGALLVKNAKTLQTVCAVPNDINAITSLVCRHGALTIGAPSSPAISNAVLFEFDQSVANECAKHEVIYTRYADDLAFSTNEPNRLNRIFDFLKSEISDLESPTLKLNDEKTCFTSRKRRRRLTGLILTSDKKVSVGREKKREIRTLIFLYLKGSLSPEKIAYLKGYLSYIKAVEPSYLTNIKAKFGKDILDRLGSEPTIKLK